ncbi:nuclease-related domain-containing protein [Sporosarcina siberiensis]|uniref:Nuclease-related domain-containing protein n=1 Tax=Sporosarcina siberiensis TaxID=1365606 RepID=A0ABW4SLK3_9BACL
MTLKAYQIEAGYSGELDVDRILHEIEFPRDTKILKNITLQINPLYTFQIDTLILTPTRAIILEIKKYSGTIQFDEAGGKTIKISNDGFVEKFDCVIHQLIRAKEGLRRWMELRNFNIHIDEILVMANQKTNLDSIPETVHMMYGKQLPRYISELPELNSSLSAQEIKSLASQIMKSQVTWNQTPLCVKYEINPMLLRNGVLCHSCNEVMYRTQGRKWHCAQCGKYGDHEVAHSLHDWFLLIKPTISNKECMDFLLLKSKFAASTTLRKSSLKRIGNPPASIYILNYKRDI